MCRGLQEERFLCTIYHEVQRLALLEACQKSEGHLTLYTLVGIGSKRGTLACQALLVQCPAAQGI